MQRRVGRRERHRSLRFDAAGRVTAGLVPHANTLHCRCETPRLAVLIGIADKRRPMPLAFATGRAVGPRAAVPSRGSSAWRNGSVDDMRDARAAGSAKTQPSAQTSSRRLYAPPTSFPCCCAAACAVCRCRAPCRHRRGQLRRRHSQTSRRGSTSDTRFRVERITNVRQGFVLHGFEDRQRCVVIAALDVSSRHHPLFSQSSIRWLKQIKD